MFMDLYQIDTTLFLCIDGFPRFGIDTICGKLKNPKGPKCSLPFTPASLKKTNPEKKTDELRKKTSYLQLPLNWLFTRDHYNGLLQSRIG